MPKQYRNVSLPKELYDKLENLVESKEGGYVSVSEAVKDAVRGLLRKHKLLPTTKRINVTDMTTSQRHKLFIDYMNQNCFAGFIKTDVGTQTYYIFCYQVPCN